MKFLKGLGRVFWTIVIVVLLLLGVLCLLLISPATSLNAEVSIFGTTMLSVTTLALPPFLGLFGGTSNELTITTSSFLNGEQQGDPIVFEGLEGTFAFDYVTFIGLIVGVIGVILILTCWRKKNLCLVGSFFSLVGTVLVGLQATFFDMLNEEALNGLFEGVGEFLNIPVVTLALGGIICAVCFGIIFIVGLFHGIIEKGEKTK